MGVQANDALKTAKNYLVSMVLQIFLGLELLAFLKRPHTCDKKQFVSYKL
jgi:hypothetical protein